MNPRLVSLLLRLYPRPWQDRYGQEFAAFLEAGPGGPGAGINVVLSALLEHAFPTRHASPAQHAITVQGTVMTPDPKSVRALTRHPDAFLPLVMSLTALTLVLVHVALHGAVHEADEGATAHLWQILMAAQLPVIAFFLIKHLRRSPQTTVRIVAIQAGAVVANIAAVFFLHLG